MQSLRRIYVAQDLQGDLPDPLETFAAYPPEMVEQATTLLRWLEGIDWKWDILTLLKQPGELMELILLLRAYGVAMRDQDDKNKTTPAE